MEENKLPDNSRNKYFYYPSLDGLRFFAFLLVFLHHSLLNISSPNFFLNYFLIIIQKNGWVGVDLFFVLSGYLITTLLLKERHVFGTFSLKNFYIRRILRIWPLYYLALILGFFIIPAFTKTQFISQAFEEIPLYLLFLGNWQVTLNGYSHYPQISHLWTISLEEQFYLLWPLLLMKITNLRRSLLTALIIIPMSAFFRLFLAVNNTHHPGIYTNTLARIDILTLGAILALVIFYSPRLTLFLKRFVKTKLVLLSLVLISIFLYKFYFFDPNLKLNVTLGYLVIGLFMTYIVFAALQSDSLFAKFLALKPFVYLGKISYGLYIWHILAIDLVFNYLNQPNLKLVSAGLSFILTCMFATLSYYLFESKFLKLKSRFTKIFSRGI